MAPPALKKLHHQQNKQDQVKHKQQRPPSPHLLLRQLSSPLVEVDVGLPQDDMGVTSADTLRRDIRALEEALVRQREHL